MARKGIYVSFTSEQENTPRLKYSDLEPNAIKDPVLAKQFNKTRGNYRAAPKGEPKLYFAPHAADISCKDEISLMDMAVFGLGKTPRRDVIVHERGDQVIKVEGGSDCGMATIFDYDIFLFVTSQLVREMEIVKSKAKSGLNDVHLPPRTIRPPIAELLKFCRRDDGGKSYASIMQALTRLKNTTISVTHLDNDRKEINTEIFDLISRVSIVANTENGTVTEVDITIPEWVYESVVTYGSPNVLTLHPEYFLLKAGFHRFLDRVARKRAGATEWTMKVEDLYKDSGTNRPLRSFKSDIKKAIKKLEIDPLPDYFVIYEVSRKGDKVHFINKEWHENNRLSGAK